MPTVPIVIETPLGSIEADLFEDNAPGTVQNFLYYVDSGLFNNGRFHRTVTIANNSNANLKTEAADAGIAETEDSAMPNDAIAIEVIQGGIDPSRTSEQRTAIALERTSDTGLAHLDGTLSMGRRTADSAVSDFFICVNDQPSLDFGGQRNVDGQGFAAFGRVTAGMEVVRAIQTAPADGQQLQPPVGIVAIRRKA